MIVAGLGLSIALKSAPGGASIQQPTALLSSKPVQATAENEIRTPTALAATQPLTPGYQNATYGIEGTPVALVNGAAEVEAAPGSAIKVITRYFGNEAFGDLNGDGREDVVFFLTQDGGGSGTFFYVAAALQGENGYQGTNAVFLGDRITPQNTSIEKGMIIVNYAERKPDEPLTAQPSVAVSKYLQVLDGVLQIINQE